MFDLTLEQNEPTSIVYKPQCGKCGFPIDIHENEIAFQDVYEIPVEITPAIKVDTIVKPDRCAHCGASFNSIVILRAPKQLNDMILEK